MVGFLLSRGPSAVLTFPFSDENSSTSTSSSSVTMAKPVFLRASMLRPSAFSAHSFSSKPATEAAEVPVIEPVATTDHDTAEVPTQPTAEDEQKSGTTEEGKPAQDPLSLLTKSNGLAKSNPFNAVQVTPLANSSGFVFGQNTRDRVTGNVEDEDAAAAGSNGDLSFSASAGPPTTSSGTPEEPGSADASSSDKEKGDAASGKSLSDVAREYEENKNARKRKFEEVETFTGEEDEINVLDVSRLVAAIDIVDINFVFLFRRSLVNCTHSLRCTRSGAGARCD